jgi:methionine-gamma-lyase
MYGGSLSLVQKLLSRFAVRYTLVDQGDVGAWADAITPETRLFLVESPSNPLLEITDLRAVAELAHAHGILTAADNTFATPINQRPLEFGIDLVWHSATKYLGGHSDASAGAVAGSRDLIQEIWNTSLNVGAVLGPFDAWLVTRGIRTLELRVGRHNANAAAIAQHLTTHPKVDAVHYPGLPTHASHGVAAGQMSGFGGVLSIEVPGGLDAAARLVEGLELFQLAASLGSVESLAVCPAAMWGALLTEQEMTAAGLRPGLVRLACGQEDARDLIQDLDRALDALEASEEQ